MADGYDGQEPEKANADDVVTGAAEDVEKGCLGSLVWFISVMLVTSLITWLMVSLWF